MLLTLLAIASIACRAEQASISYVQPLRHEAENGAAAICYKADLQQPFFFSADLSLPRMPNNKGWYAIWLMLAELKGTAQLPSMLQIGLIRWDQSHGNLQPFIATEHSGASLKYQPIRIDLSGTHRFAISCNAELVTLTMDKRALMTAKRLEFFKDSNVPIYLKLAAEVYADGDEISGIARNVSLETDHEMTTPMPWAGIKDRGLKFHCDAYGAWTAGGVFDPSLRREFYQPVCPTPEDPR